MNDTVYHRLAKALNDHPNGFPATNTGVEIELLKSLFDEEEADMFCELKGSFETAEEIAKRTGRKKESVENILLQMRDHGLLAAITIENKSRYKMLPWAWGIYEMQINRVNEKSAKLMEKYYNDWGASFFSKRPKYPLVIPIEETIPVNYEALSYERVSSIIEANTDFAVNECMCRKVASLIGNPCKKPIEVCLGIASIDKFFDSNINWGRRITKEEAYSILDVAEEAGLVHVTSNIQRGHFYICNCCGCCCSMIRSINQLNITNSFNTNFYANIDNDKCINCRICIDDRCPINAIEEKDNYLKITDKCFGCGLCIKTCPTEAIELVRKESCQIVEPPKYESKWFRARNNYRRKEK